MKTLHVNFSNENVLHVSLWKRNYSYGRGGKRRENSVCGGFLAVNKNGATVDETAIFMSCNVLALAHSGILVV